MRRKFSVLVIITMLLSISFMVIVNKDMDVEATGGGGGGEGDTHFNPYYDYLWDNITTNLSNVVHKAYPSGENVIRKGRAFGTPGDDWTAEYLYDELKDNLSLDNVQQIPLTELDSKKTDPVYIPGLPWKCNYKVETIDFKMEVNNDNYEKEFQNPMPKNETFVFPSARPDNSKTPYTMNYKNTFTNAELVALHFYYVLHFYSCFCIFIRIFALLFNINRGEDSLILSAE